VLGLDHLDTLTTRYNFASWTGEAGDAAGAVLQFQGLLRDRERVLGPGHPIPWPHGTASRPGLDGAGTRRAPSAWYRGWFPTWKGCSARATRTPWPPGANEASLTGECGDAAGALRLLRGLLPDAEQAFGRTTPDILTIRCNFAYLTMMKERQAGRPR
jgi:hypothetical protein